MAEALRLCAEVDERPAFELVRATLWRVVATWKLPSASGPPAQSAPTVLFLLTATAGGEELFAVLRRRVLELAPSAVDLVMIEMNRISETTGTVVHPRRLA